MNAVTHSTVTAGTTNATNLIITDAISYPGEQSVSGSLQGKRLAVFFIKIVSGTVQFGIGAIDANSKAWASTDTIPPLTCPIDQLYFKAASGADTFVVGV